MHHDGMWLFPLPFGSVNTERALLAVNHEYTDENLLHPDGWEPVTAEKVAKSQACHGVSVVEIAKEDGTWKVVPSERARRVTARSPVMLTGPAAGHPLVQTRADPEGTTVVGTMNNCANGYTPWGTYLSCEENFHGYFANPDGDVLTVPDIDQKAEILAGQSRYGIGQSSFYGWDLQDERFDASIHPNEPNRFGWVVEIDPYNPGVVPAKRTALGRIKHENAALSWNDDGILAVYMGDDQRFEYIYKFVGAKPWWVARAAGESPLDEGTLHVARFNDDGSGDWLPLVHGEGGLTAENGFADQAEVLVKTRQAADVVGATKMDRPEWIAVDPRTGNVYCALTNNSRRGTGDNEGATAANPRDENVYGHIIRWADGGNGDDPSATAFTWDIFILGPLRQHPQQHDARRRRHHRRDQAVPRRPSRL